MIREIDRLMARECFREALEKLRGATAENENQAWQLALRETALLADLGEGPVDDGILRLDELIDASAAPADELPRAHAMRVGFYVRKRVRPLAEAALRAAAEAGFQDRPELLVAAGRLFLEFDDRTNAEAQYTRALEVAPSSALARLALCGLRYLLGDFASSLEMGRPLRDDVEAAGPCWPRAMRTAAWCASATRQFADEVQAWSRLLEGCPDGKFSDNDRVSLAYALAAQGQRDQAVEQLRKVWLRTPDSDIGRYVRKRLDHVEAARARGGEAKLQRLREFPTVAQKRNYCGPAVLELCLRYLGIELHQDEIAAVVKRESGTPMYEIVSFLEANGIAARRMEVTPERLKRALDLGLPVIVQEEYSTTSHVAVMTGYDEFLGVFFANDPMTHRPEVKSLEWTEHAGDLYGNGGVLVLGRRGDDLQKVEIAADAAELVEAEHLVLLDSSSRRRPRLENDSGPDVAAEEVIRVCDQAMDLKPDFKLAWSSKLWALSRLYHTGGRQRGTEQRLLSHLERVRINFSGEEWPHQAHAEWLASVGRCDEAYVEFMQAHRLDPGDANNLQSMGECMWIVRDFAAAERHIRHALALECDHVRAAENLSGVYLAQIELAQSAQAEDDEDEEENWAPETPPKPARTTLPGEPEEWLRRARHFNEVALSSNYKNPFNHWVRGRLLRFAGELTGAAATLRTMLEMAPQRSDAHTDLARVLIADGKWDEARALCQQLCERIPGLQEGWLLQAEVVKRQDKQAAVDILEHGLAACRDERAGFAQPLFSAYELESGSHEVAAGRLREQVEKYWGDEALLRRAAQVLDHAEQRGHTISLLRHVLERAPGDINIVYRLGCLLGEDVLTEAEGQAMLEQVREQAPEAPFVCERLGWLYLKSDPQAGVAMMEPLLQSEDPSILETASALHEATGDSARAQALHEAAIAAHRSRPEGLVWLCRYHLHRDRYDRAKAAARALNDGKIPASMKETAERLLLSSFRLGGGVRELLDWVRERSRKRIPKHLAWNIYWGMRSIDHDLASRAAITESESETDPDERLEWMIRAAGERAQTGDNSLLEKVQTELGSSSAAWATLSDELEDLKRYDEANAAAERALALDDKSMTALRAMQGTALRRGDLAAAMGFARRARELHPYEHVGDERLGLLFGKQLEIEPALAHSLRAISIAPFCHIAQQSRAVALFVAGDFAGAERHARRSIAIEEPKEPDAGNDGLILVRALTGDVAGLARCLSHLEAEEPLSLFPRYFAALRARAQEQAKKT